MLELQVVLPREQKIIEWDKASPTFCEIKERLGNCGVAKGWCVEILREGEYVSPDDDMRLKDCKKLTVRASPIAETVPVGEGPSTAFASGWSLNSVYLSYDSQKGISNWWWPTSCVQSISWKLFIHHLTETVGTMVSKPIGSFCPFWLQGSPKLWCVKELYILPTTFFLPAD